MPFVCALQALDKVIKDLDSCVLYRKKVLRLRVMEKVLNKFLRGYMCFFRMGDELLDWTLKVGLLERTAASAKPSDEVVCLHIAFVLDINKFKKNFSSILKVMILIRQRPSKLRAWHLKIF